MSGAITSAQVAQFLDRMVLSHMAERSAFGPLETYHNLNGFTAFTGEYFDRDMIRAILRNLLSRGYCQYRRGLFDEDGTVAGSGYAITAEGLAYYERLSQDEDRSDA